MEDDIQNYLPTTKVRFNLYMKYEGCVYMQTTNLAFILSPEYLTMYIFHAHVSTLISQNCVAKIIIIQIYNLLFKMHNEQKKYCIISSTCKF